MHAVRGTVGYDPNTPSPAAKRASRDRHFGIDRQNLLAAADGVWTHFAVADELVTANADDRFLVEWVNPQGGHERYSGRAGGIPPEAVGRLISALVRSGRAHVFTVTRTR